MIRPSSIFGKLCLLTLTILVPLVGFILVGSFMMAAKEMSRRAETSLAESLKKKAARIENFISKASEDLRILKRIPPVEGILRALAHDGFDPQDGSGLEQLRNRLNKGFAVIIETQPFFAHISFMDKEGMELARVISSEPYAFAVPVPDLRNGRNLECFKETAKLKNTEIFYSSIRLNRTEGVIDLPHNSIMMLTTQATDEVGAFAGVICLGVHITKILHVLGEDKDLKEPNFHFIADETGAYLHHSLEEAKEFGGPGDLNTDHGITADFQGHENAILSGALCELPFPDGKKVVVSEILHLWPNKKKFLAFSGIVPQTGDFWKLPQGFRIIGLILLAISLLAVGITWRTSSWFTAPIYELVEAIARFQSGDPTARVLSPGGDEIGEIARIFNQLADGVSNQYEILEAKVAERTAELEMARQALLDSNSQLEGIIRNLNEAKNAALAANRAKGQFLSNMSHELKTPMNAVLGFSHLALRLRMPDPVRDYIIKIHAAGITVLRLINDILDFSQIEEGKVNLEINNFDLQDVVTDLSNVVSQNALTKRLNFFFSIPPEIPRKLIGDPLRLGQILEQLLNNAVKFTEKGEVELSIAVQGETPAQVKLRFAVRDTGIGMTQEEQKLIVQPFSQADGSTTRKFGGTGLGLALSRKLVAMLGGELLVDSQLGRGSCFHVSDKMSFRIPSSSIEGLDIASGLKRVGGDPAFYWNLVQRFAAEQPKALVEIAEAVCRGDSISASRLTHSIKGVAGNLGAVKVHSLAQALEKAFKADDPEKIQTSFTLFSKEVLSLVKNVHDNCSLSLEPAEPLSSALLTEVLVEFAAHLKNGNYELFECFEKLKGNFVSSQKLAGNVEGAKRPTAGDEGCEVRAQNLAPLLHPEGGRVPPFIEKLRNFEQICRSEERYELEAAVARGDFAGALELLRQIATRLNIKIEK